MIVALGGDLRVADMKKCCDTRVEDIRKDYKERSEDQKQLVLVNNPINQIIKIS